MPAHHNSPSVSIMWPLASALLAVLVTGTCAHAQANSTVYYRLLVDSFRDGDGDGFGDLKGATKQVSYVRALGADAVILSPLNARSTDCSTPGSLELTDIDPRYGGLDGFNAFLEKAKKLELKVLITVPVQTVSTASQWFIQSANRVAGYEDRVVWMDGTPEEPPKPQSDITWTRHEPRNAYYATINKEALLNFCSEGTVAAVAAAQCAWLRRGVAGLVINPDYQLDQRCGEQLLRKIAAEAMSCARAAGLDSPLILVESYLPPGEAARYYSNGGLGANSVISNALTAPERRSAAELAVDFHAARLFAPLGEMPTWMTSAPYESRITARHGNELVDAINLLALALPGDAIVQQGDELGAADAILEWANLTTCWPGRIAPSSAPHPWDDSTHGGFTPGEPWLPLAPNYRYANAKAEFANELSHMGVVRVAAALRKSPAMGAHAEITRLGEAVAILRWGSAGSLLVVSNVAREQTEAQLWRIPGLPAEMTVAAVSAGSSLSPGSHVSVEKGLRLSPGETVLLVGPPRHCGGPGPVDKIANKLSEGWQKLNKYFSNS